MAPGLNITEGMTRLDEVNFFLHLLTVDASPVSYLLEHGQRILVAGLGLDVVAHPARHITELIGQPGYALAVTLLTQWRCGAGGALSLARLPAADLTNHRLYRMIVAATLNAFGLLSFPL